MKTLDRPQGTGLAVPAPVQQIQLHPIFSKGLLVEDNWWVQPEPETKGFFRRHWLFLLTVCIPVALAAVYYGLVATAQYESEAQFVVRTAARSDSANLASLLQNQKISRASDETFAVADYIVSRDSLRALLDNNHLRQVISHPEADFLSRFPNLFTEDNFEALYRYFRNFVDVKINSDSGIATLKVRSFNSRDSRAMAIALLANSQDLVNKLNERVYNDSLRLANKFVDEETAKLSDAERQLTEFRNGENVIDPGKESTAALSNLSKQMGALLQAESSLSQEIAQAPQSPHIPGLRESVLALQKQVDTQRAQVSGATGSLAGKLGTFENLMIERELAARGLAAAQSRAIAARQDNEQQQYYLETVVEPNQPDVAAFPRRFVNVLLVLGVSGCIFGIMRVLLTNMREHQA